MEDCNFKNINKIKAVEKLSKRRKWIEHLVNKETDKQEIVNFFSDFSEEELKGIFELLIEIVNPEFI